jgi:hypothetical protein
VLQEHELYDMPRRLSSLNLGVVIHLEDGSRYPPPGTQEPMPRFPALDGQDVKDREPALRAVPRLAERGNARSKGLVGGIQKVAEGGVGTALEFAPGQLITEEPAVNVVFAFSAPDGVLRKRFSEIVPLEVAGDTPVCGGWFVSLKESDDAVAEAAERRASGFLELGLN